MNVLIVSGDTDTVNGLRKLLAGFAVKDVTSAKTGVEGVTLIKEKAYMESSGVLFGKKPVKTCEFKLVIVDEVIPDLTVLDFVRVSRKLFDRKTLPVMLLTEGNNREGLMEALKAGANNFVLKPVGSAILKDKIVELTGGDGISVISPAAGIFQKEPVKKKHYTGSSTLKMMSSGGKRKGGGTPIGAYYAAGKRESGKSNDEAPEVVDDGSLINGHYHEQVDVIGGGTTCVWGKESGGAGKVVLEYVSPKGRPTGIHVKTISKNDFLKNYRVCTPDICGILKRLEEDK